jgi:hypothetical protein
MKKYAFIIALFFAVDCAAQVNYQVKVMSWNILNWPELSTIVADTTSRGPSYRTVVNYANPDILVTMENTASYSTTWFLNQVMNANVNEYSAGTFLNGYDTDNGIFYRDSLFTFISNQPIQTSLRDINHFTLVFKPTGDTLHIFAVHLKAAQGYEAQRAGEVANLRAVTNAFPPGTNFLVAGDFNFYGDNEQAYAALLQDNPGDDGNFNDVWNLTGVWNDPSYSFYHTQSTRLNSGSGGSGGGMDDRFDMILYSNAIAQPTGIYFLPGSYTNIGNDGNHYNESVNYGFNSAVPSSVANALYNASDHLPVSMILSIGPTSDISELSKKINGVNIYPMPVDDDSKLYFTLKEPGKVLFSLKDISGRILFEKEDFFGETGNYSYPINFSKLTNGGFYLLSIKYDNVLITKKLISIR